MQRLVLLTELLVKSLSGGFNKLAANGTAVGGRFNAANRLLWAGLPPQETLGKCWKCKIVEHLFAQVERMDIYLSIEQRKTPVPMSVNTTFKSNYEQVRELKVAGNAKAIFSQLRLDEGFDMGRRDFTEWSDNAEIILEEVAKNGSGFKKDIATKALKYKSISEKQAWCVAFDFIAISKLSF